MSDDTDSRAWALGVAVAYVRRHPELPTTGGADSAWLAVLDSLRRERAVARYLGRRHRDPDALWDLLDDAADYITHRQPAEIQAHYQGQRAAGAYDDLNGSQRLVLLAIFVQAMRPDRAGGRRVVMSRRYLRTLVASQFGRTLDERAIGDAVRRLVFLGHVTIRPGKPWGPGGARSTQYELPTLDNLSPTQQQELTPLALPAEIGLGELAMEVRVVARRRGWVELPERVPVMTEDTYRALEIFQGGRREDKHRHGLGVVALPAAPAPERVDLGHLLDQPTPATPAAPAAPRPANDEPLVHWDELYASLDERTDSTLA